MLLTLRILSNDGGPPASSDSAVIDEQGGRIGRGKAMSLSLPDTERIISNEHAVISFEDGGFVIADTSTNGTFINDSDVALGRGNSAPVSNGDQFRIGRFVIGVEIADSPAAQPAQPALPAAPEVAAPLAANPLLDTPGTGEGADIRASSPLQGSTPLSEMPSAGLGADTPGPGLTPQVPPLMSGVKPPQGGSLIPDDNNFIPNDFGSGDLKPSGPAGGEASAQSDGAHLLSTAFRMPGVATDPALKQDDIPQAGPPAGPPQPGGTDSPVGIQSAGSGIPTDWHEGEESQISDDAPGAPLPTPTSEPVGVQGQGAGLPQDWANADPLPPADIPPADIPPAVVPLVAVQKAPQPAAEPPAPIDDVLTRILESAGLGAVDLSGVSAEVVAENLGSIVREAVDGVVEVLRDRSNFKSEFRIDMTRIQASENNPLKFSTTTEDVVRQLLTDERDGLMVAGDAFREAFDDLRIHQLAMMVALKACLSALMAQFDPAAIQEQSSRRGGFKAKVLSSRSADFQERFLEVYGKLAEDADEGFKQLLANEFVRAYEEQVDRLHRARFEAAN